MHDPALNGRLDSGARRRGRSPGSRKCNCCPFGYHLDLDFVRYCEKVANSQFYQSSRHTLPRSRVNKKERESIESLLGCTPPRQEQQVKQVPSKIERTIIERKTGTTFSDDLAEAVSDFEKMFASSTRPRSVGNAGNGTQLTTTLDKNLSRIELPVKISQQTNAKRVATPENSEQDAHLLTKINGVYNPPILEDIRYQMVVSLDKIKKLEGEAKAIPYLQSEQLRLRLENDRLTEIVKTNSKIMRTQAKEFEMKIKIKVPTSDVSTQGDFLPKDNTVSTACQVDYQQKKPETRDVCSQTEYIPKSFSNRSVSPFLFDNQFQKNTSPTGSCSNISLKCITERSRDFGIQCKPLHSDMGIMTIKCPTIEKTSQTTCIQKKGFGCSVNLMPQTPIKSNIGVNTEPQKLPQKQIISKYTDSSDLYKTANAGVNTNELKLLEISVDTSGLKDFVNGNKSNHQSRKYVAQFKDQSPTATSIDSLKFKANEKVASSDEIREKTSSPPPVISKPYQKKEPSKEMKAAMKVLNDNLLKSPSGEMPRNMKNAGNIIQQEWFKVSSTADADPLEVEDYLDCFEEISVGLLEHIVNMTDVSGNSAMHYAVSNGNFDVVSILLDSKVCNINTLNTAGYTCIMVVALTKVKSETDKQVVKRLFHMADVNIRAKQHGQTALMLAVSHGRIETVELLLESGADINIQDEDGSTALMCAAEHGYIDIVKLLLAQTDCDLSLTDLDGNTALNIAMEANNRDIGVLLYAQEHFSRGNILSRRDKSTTPTLKTRSPKPSSQEYSS